MSYIRAFRPVVPSESLIQLRENAKKLLAEVDFANNNPLIEARPYPLDSLRVTLFERRARGKNSNDALGKLATVLSDDKLTITRRTRTRPEVFKTITRRVPNPLVAAIAGVEAIYLADQGTSDGGYAFNLRSNQIIDSTEDDYRSGGTELALLLDENAGQRALMAQHDIYEDKASSMMSERQLTKPQWHERLGGLVIPFMVAPFDTEGDRDEFIEALTAHEPVVLPVHGLQVGDIDWSIKK